ncbi:MAG: hypothetical protein JW904_03060 [Spirochaetales bacterium]|nr:hypothetical protein [Spirochaetales bacterium]
MLVKINSRMSEADFEKIDCSSEKTVELDCGALKFFTSKEISRLLIYATKYKKTILLKNTNDHIRETVHLLKLEHIFRLDE